MALTVSGAGQLAAPCPHRGTKDPVSPQPQEQGREGARGMVGVTVLGFQWQKARRKVSWFLEKKAQE